MLLPNIFWCDQFRDLGQCMMAAAGSRILTGQNVEARRDEVSAATGIG